MATWKVGKGGKPGGNTGQGEELMWAGCRRVWRWGERNGRNEASQLKDLGENGDSEKPQLGLGGPQGSFI